MDEGPLRAEAAAGQSRFGVAPPRRFLLPAILLLLSEQPRHGYSVMKELRGFHFGNVDRPSVYRALAQLESDGYARSWSDESDGGRSRHMYGLTPDGERVLRVWMGVIKADRDCLDLVLRRYQATGSADAMIAEVEGEWGSVLGAGWSSSSSMSSTSPAFRPHAADVIGLSIVESPPLDDPTAVEATAQRFELVPERSVVIIDVRSSVGPISFGALGATGSIDAVVLDGAVAPDTQPSAHLRLAVDGLRSGNSLYDAELLRRIDARKFPTATIDLCEASPAAGGGRYNLAGDLTFHGVTRRIDGAVSVTIPTDGTLVVDGEQAFDIRDFDLASPTVLMLRIFPDVKVRLHVEATLAD
jgi:DNA-binding PadR family transcriptional regulator/polyisoprenoid-binding protein YceI